MRATSAGLTRSRRIRRGEPFSQDRLEDAPNILGQNALAGGVGMDAIPLVERGISADPFQEIRNQRGATFFRERGEDSAEGAYIIVARIIGELHAGDND